MSGQADELGLPEVHARSPAREERPFRLKAQNVVNDASTTDSQRARGEHSIAKVVLATQLASFLGAPGKNRTCDLGFRNSPREITTREHSKSSEESVYSAAEETPVPALSHDPAVLRAELERATAAGEWVRVAKLARALAASELGRDHDLEVRQRAVLDVNRRRRPAVVDGAHGLTLSTEPATVSVLRERDYR